MDKKRALGKGLSALIPEDFKGGVPRDILSVLDKDEGRIVSLKLFQIKPSRFQPRVDFNDSRLNELIASIKEKGILQPILVRSLDNGYELIAGERRLRAAKALKYEEIPAIVKSVKDEEALVLSIVENVQREELNPIEEAHAFQRLITEFNFTQDIVAQSVGKDRTSIANTMRLLKLPLEIQDLVSNSRLSMGHAKALLSLANPKDQVRVARVAVNKDLSVREIENVVKRMTGDMSSRRRLQPKKSLEIVALEEKLQHALGTKVRIVSYKKRGKIIVDYYSDEDLSRITEVITK